MNEFQQQPAEENPNMWAMILHLSQLLNFILPLAGIIAPIVIWQIKKDSMPIIDAHGKNAVNWIISTLIYSAVCFVLTFILIGILGFAILGILAIVFPIIAGIKANSGEVWEYPLTIRVFK